ncbi:TPA: aminomethyl-transferring glycine dehydrogenase subunit GcvPA [Candidatus Scatenecus faecavium]|uniref:Aminomethyl-transferring glycine dehydrogenase subunit GcvPA n=1 Tax=Candidatus Scatenecus faecavium TaxID=2840915 RepID=A0A9D1FUJ6_9BACT|nr:aminomethyl-transferring glycine dehydrogenase subunit GcvPA [Candidatus Scatenecus faecavium]
MKNFLVHNDKTKSEMLDAIGLKRVEDLFSQIPQEARMANLNLPKALSEMETQKVVKSLANKNKSDYISFLGGGVYNKFIPACISQIAQRFEFLTAYTPYQAEISQGTLQIMYEFQTMISRLTGMDISNATVYDGGTACAEAILMARRISRKSKALVSKNLNPEYKKVIDTYAWGNDIEIEYFENLPENTADFACVLMQTPDYYGEIIDVKPVDTLLIVCTDISTLSILKPPSEYGADIVVGDIQTLGIPQEFGGPHAGFIACREKFMRQLPGRLAGRTVDADGNQAFCLTIQTREQHIKREKSTSNICSNQALIGLCATVYLSLLGENGFKQAGYLSTKQAHKLSEKLSQKGIRTLNKNFFNEFVIEVPNSDKTLSTLKSAGILGGIRLDETKILVAATEMISDEDIEKYFQNV